jgi:hypothetical protein
LSLEACAPLSQEAWLPRSHRPRHRIQRQCRPRRRWGLRRLRLQRPTPRWPVQRPSQWSRNLWGPGVQHPSPWRPTSCRRLLATFCSAGASREAWPSLVSRWRFAALAADLSDRRASSTECRLQARRNRNAGTGHQTARMVPSVALVPSWAALSGVAPGPRHGGLHAPNSARWAVPFIDMVVEQAPQLIADPHTKGFLAMLRCKSRDGGVTGWC